MRRVEREKLLPELSVVISEQERVNGITKLIYYSCESLAEAKLIIPVEQIRFLSYSPPSTEKSF